MQDTDRFTTRIFLAFVTMLLAIGTLMVYSASMSSRSLNAEQIYLSKHLSFLCIAIVIGFVVSQIPSRVWYQLSPFLFLIATSLLVCVLLPGVGHRVKGAQRWIKVGPVSVQPSEFAKLALPLMVCWLRFSLSGEEKKAGFLQVISTLLLIGMPIGLVLVEPDLGTTLFLVLSCGLALFLSGWPIRYFVIASTAIVPPVIGLVALKPYQLARIQGFIQTWTSPEDAPYQVRQSLTTLGVGGIQGTGLGKGWQKLSFLPESNTDFIFSVIGEELGMIGTLGVMTLWIGMYLSGMKLIKRIPEVNFESVLATTLLTQLVFQAALNIAVVTAMVPPKGISHPLISYGGSNLVTTIVSIGLILSLVRNPAHQITELLDEQTDEDQDSEFELPVSQVA